MVADPVEEGINTRIDLATAHDARKWKMQDLMLG
jgi:hypothetical protein